MTTALEMEVLRNLANCEVRDGNPDLTEPVWTEYAHAEDPSLIGALGSCVKKGLVDDWGETSALTELGLRALRLASP